MCMKACLVCFTVWSEVALQLPFFFYGAWAFAVGDPRVQKPVRSCARRSSQQHSREPSCVHGVRMQAG